MMTDPIADMLTRIRNALRIRQSSCIVPGSRIKVDILEAIKREGYIAGYEVHGEGPRATIRVDLKYADDGSQVISRLDRYSRPGRRRYRAVGELPKVRGGLGVAIVSTNRGVLSDRECRAQNVGGEVLLTID
jgi:small subunit ribosomal protein S8